MPRTLLPYVANGETVYPMGMSEKAATFVDAWLSLLPESRRKLMHADARVIRAAQLHAEYLAARTQEEIEARADVKNASHYGLDWSTPNERVRAQGYRLPANYPIKGNMVESNARDGGGPLSALQTLLDSDAHRPHLLGEPGFSDRVVFGVGVAQNDYCVLVCPKEA